MNKFQINKIKMYSKLNLREEIIEFKFNWISLLLITTFFVYGYFGYGSAKFTKSNLSVHLILILFILILLSMLLMLKHLEAFDDKLSLNRKDLIIFMYFFCFITFMARKYLNEYQSQDELSYLGTAFQYPRKILSLIDFIPGTFKSNLTIQALAFIILIFNLLFFKLLLKVSHKNMIIAITIVTFSLHIILGTSGAYLIGYSKINVLPYSIFGSIFGISPIVFKITTICIISITLSFVCKFLLNTIKVPTIVLLAILTVFISTPIEFFHYVIVEQSIYFFIFGIIPLIEVFFRKSSNYKRFIPFLVIGVYFRSTVLIILFIYVISAIFQSKSKKEILHVFLPITILIPYIYGLIISPIGAKDSASKIDIAKLSSTIIRSLDIPFGRITIMISIVGFILLAITSRKRIFFLLAYSFLSIFLFFIYLSPDLIGLQKYQQEWFSPIYLISIIYFIYVVFTKLRISNQIISTIGTLTIILLCVQYFYQTPDHTSFSKKFQGIDQNFSKETYFANMGLSFFPYPYSKAFEYVKNEYGSQKCLNSGVVYNLFPEIFSGVSVSEYKFLETQRENFLTAQIANNSNWTSVNVMDLNTSKVSCVLIGSTQNKQEVIDSLLKNHWVIKKIFWSSFFPTSVVVMQR